jgi:hypothetical protein
LQNVSTGTGYVYFLQERFNEDGPIKVGYSGDPARRCYQINLRLKHEPLTVLAAFPGSRSEERELHKRWAHHRITREWFRPAPEILAAIDLCRDEERTDA